MSRPAPDLSWHLFALAIVIAGLSVLAPLAWWQAHPPGHESAHDRGRRPLARETPGRTLPAEAPLEQPELAPLGPLVADQIQIDLDPSITETPALPAPRASGTDDPLQIEATGELRLSATLARPVQPVLPDPIHIEP